MMNTRMLVVQEVNDKVQLPGERARLLMANETDFMSCYYCMTLYHAF